MRIKIFQHVHYESAGNILEWAKLHHYDYEIIDIRHEQIFPDFDTYEMLIVLGGPMSVNSDKLSWLSEEIDYIKEAINRGKFVLGICLGAQMISKSLGAQVRPTQNPEIGWFNVNLNYNAIKCPYLKNLTSSFTAFHWHGEVFDIPFGYQNVMSSEGNTNQAFYGKNFLALQCHFEVTMDSITVMLDNTGKFLPVSKYVQEADEIINNLEKTNEIKKTLFIILDNIINNFF